MCIVYKVDFNKSVEMNLEPTTSAADVLKETMEYHEITQIEFAKHIAISQKQLSFILNRKAFMSIQVANKIKKATGISAKWLLQLDIIISMQNIQKMMKMLHASIGQWANFEFSYS